MTINTAEIEARLADMIANGVTVTATGNIEISDDLIATLAATEAALKAETARANGNFESYSRVVGLHTSAREKIAELEAGREALVDWFINGADGLFFETAAEYIAAFNAQVK